MLQNLVFPTSTIQLPIFSGGLKKRVALAKTLMSDVDLLILDEPTVTLMQTRVMVSGSLASSPRAILLITHDRYFLDAVTTRIVELDGQTHLVSGQLRKLCRA